MSGSGNGDDGGVVLLRRTSLSKQTTLCRKHPTWNLAACFFPPKARMWQRQSLAQAGQRFLAILSDVS